VALFSAIMMVGALVEVTVGITGASMTRSPSRPWTHSRSSTTAIASGPILQVQVAWKTVEPYCRAYRLLEGLGRDDPRRAIALGTEHARR
jgi:hypothetical protein